MATRTATAKAGRDVTAELAYLTRALERRRCVNRWIGEPSGHGPTRGPTRSSWPLAWQRRSPPGSPTAAKAASARPVPARKSIEEFDFDHARGLRRDTVAHLGGLDFVTGRENVVFLGPPGTGKTHLAIGLAIRACQAGHRVLFATASEWVARLAQAHHSGHLQDELCRLGRYRLLVIDEVGYIPFGPEAANLFFQHVSSRYERASLIVTSNKPFGCWARSSVTTSSPPR